MRQIVFPKLIVSCVVILVGALAGTAQDTQGNKSGQSKPDFSGVWLFDRKKSNVGSDKPDTPIKISHHEPEIRISYTSESSGKTVESVFVYYTDGRGETNQATAFLTLNPRDLKPGDVEKKTLKSTTKWSGKKLVSRALLRMAVGSHMLEFESVDEWKLSSDGKVLSQTNRVVFQQSSGAFIPAALPEKKRVYNRI
jgi:hypothetical protein